MQAIQAQVGSDRVLCALSGGVDSSVAAALVHKAIGSQLTCVYVDTGLMRAGEAEQVEDTFRGQFQIDLVRAKAGDRFLEALHEVVEPEEKRKAIGATFIRVFEEVAADVDNARFLVQGTLYPDVIESGTEDAARIKSHHNPFAPCSRTRCGPWARSSGCPRRSCGVSPSPVRGWRCGSSAP